MRDSVAALTKELEQKVTEIITAKPEVDDWEIAERMLAGLCLDCGTNKSLRGKDICFECSLYLSPPGEVSFGFRKGEVSYWATGKGTGYPKSEISSKQFGVMYESNFVTPMPKYAIVSMDS